MGDRSEMEVQNFNGMQHSSDASTVAGSCEAELKACKENTLLTHGKVIQTVIILLLASYALKGIMAAWPWPWPVAHERRRCNDVAKSGRERAVNPVPKWWGNIPSKWFSQFSQKFGSSINVLIAELSDRKSFRWPLLWSLLPHHWFAIFEHKLRWMGIQGEWMASAAAGSVLATGMAYIADSKISAIVEMWIIIGIGTLCSYKLVKFQEFEKNESLDHP